MKELDLLAASVVVVGKDKLDKLRELVDTQQKYADAVSKLEERVKNGKRLIQQIEEDLIPELMHEIGMSEYKLTDGTRITINPIVAGRIPSQSLIDKAKGAEREKLIEVREQCLAWLTSQGAESIIKRDFSFNLGKDSNEIVKELIEVAKKLDVDFDTTETVHANSLNAYLRESIENGVDVPADIFGLFVGDKAKIVKPKN